MKLVINFKDVSELRSKMKAVLGDLCQDYSRLTEPTTLVKAVIPAEERMEVPDELLSRYQKPVDLPKILESMPFSQPPPVKPEANSTDLDISGIPWDERIHSAAKTKSTDGSWRRRRGVEDDEFDKVEKELKGVKQPQAVLAFVPVVPPPVVIPQPPMVAPDLSLLTPINLSPSVPVPPPAYSPTQAHTYQSFKDGLVGVIASLINEGKIDQHYIDSLKSYFGVKEIWNVFSNDKQVAEMYENFCAAGLITKVT